MPRFARRMPSASTLAVLTCFAVAASGHRAHAQQPAPSRGDVAAAQALFDDAKRLMDAKRFDEACPKLAESQRLDPGGGTTLVLAICHEGEGKLASAWADYNQALTEARRDKRADRERAASTKIQELGPRLPRIQLTASGNEPGLEIKRDGVAIGRAQWGTPVPVDPGEYVFEAAAPGKSPWRGTAKVGAEARTHNIMIPALADAPAATAAVSPPPARAITPAPTATPPPTNAAPEPTPEPKSDRWLVTGFIGGAGMVLVGVGAVVGLSAKSTWADLERSCPGNRCPNDGLVQEGKSVGRRANVSTGLVLVGAAAVTTALIMNLAWPDSSASANRASIKAAPYFSHDGAGFALGGTL